MAVGDDIIYAHIVWLGIYFIYELKIVSHAYGQSFQARKQSVVIALATAHSVAVAVIGHCGYYDHVDTAEVVEYISVRLLDIECAQVHAASLVWEHVEIDSVYTWQIKMLAVGPAFDKFAGR